jgi:hypothetical protein
MRTIRTIMATTHVDPHNERLTLEALESMKDYINSAYLPFIFNHDPRCPPLGRAVPADVVTLADGEHAIEAEVEVFESGEHPTFDESRAVRYRQLPRDGLVLTVDRNFSQPEFDAPVAAIAAMFGRSPEYEVKKALDPIAVLGTGLGAVAVGKFAGAFFSKLGSNAADARCAHLTDLFRRRTSGQVQLLRLEFEFDHGGRQCRAEVIATGPSEADINGLLREGLSDVDTLLPTYLESGVTRYVFEYSRGKATLTFAVRSDAVPPFPVSEGEA